MNRKTVTAWVVCLMAFVSALGLSAWNQTTLRGELTADGAVRFQELSAELSATDAAGSPDRAAVGPDGRFEFRNVTIGNYRLRIHTFHGDTLREDYITVHAASPSIQIHLRTAGARAPGGPISLRRLQHKPAKMARKEWSEAGKCAGRGDHAGAISHLERSVALDPEYFDAQFSLGSERVMVGDANGALDAFEKALEIDPSSAQALVNRGMLLLHFRRAEEAEQDARKALALADSTPAHYVLGLSLAVRNKNLEDAAEHLRQSLSRYPSAKNVLDRIQLHLQSK